MSATFFKNNQSIVFVTAPIGQHKAADNGLSLTLVQVNSVSDEDKKKVPAFYVNDFDLKKAGIVEKTWSESERPQYQDFFAKVAYENGFVISAEMNKVSVFDLKPSTGSEEKNFIDRVQKLHNVYEKIGIKTESLGINFSLVLPSNDPDEYIYDYFLNKGIFGKLEKKTERPSLKISYKIEDAITLNLSIYSAEKKNLKHVDFTEDKCVIVDANFHHDLQDIDAKTKFAATHEKLELLKKIIPIRG